MSAGSNLSGINFGGLSSGIDTNSIISRLLQLESLPAQRLNAQKVQLQNRQTLYSTFKGQLQNLSSKASALTNASSFASVSATTSKPEVATVTATDGAVAGTYSLNVTSLAKFNKISTVAQTDTTTALNLSGEFVVNGKTVTVGTTDTLTTLSQKINGLNVGVTASVINGGTSNAFLTVTSSNSGATNKIQISDAGAGTVAQTLGLVSGAASILNPVTNGMASFGFSSTSSTLATLLGNSDRGPGTFEINGSTVNVDFATDTLQSLATKISNAGAGVAATVETVKVNGVDKYRIKVTGGATPTFTDANNILGELGFVQKSFGNQLVAAQSAAFQLDNVNFTSETNSVSTVVPGVTFNLLKDADSTVITLSQDNSAVKSKIKDFVAAYNGLVDFITANSSFDDETYETGVLFGDSTIQTVESTLAQQMLSTVSGLKTSYSNLTQLGVTFDEDAKISLDESILDTALLAGPSAVGNVFRSTGVSTVDSLSYVSSTGKTKASTGDGFAINITQVSTKTQSTFALTGPTTLSDKLTFNGAIFGNTAYDFNIGVGATVDSIVTAINSDAKLKDLITASNSGGSLKIEGKRYGTPGDFTVVSQHSGGDPGPDVVLDRTSMVAGVNVAGTINGEAATGSGQFLTGNTRNAKTEGFQIQYTGTTTGNVGQVSLSIGVASSISFTIAQFTDTVAGLLKGADDAIAAQITSIDESIASIEERMRLKETELRRRFAAMEASIAEFQQQAQRLSAISSQASSNS